METGGLKDWKMRGGEREEERFGSGRDGRVLAQAFSKTSF